MTHNHKKITKEAHNNSKRSKVAQSQGTTGSANLALYPAYGGRWRPAKHYYNFRQVSGHLRKLA